MLMVLLTAACAFKITAEEKVSGPIPKNTPPKTGFVTGKVTFGPLLPGPEREDNSTGQNQIAEKMYDAHKVSVLDEHGKRTIREVAINKEGIYKVELPPGKYVLQVTPPGIGRFKKEFTKVEVKARETVQMDISIDTGMR
jgi:hypothetical protein